MAYEPIITNNAQAKMRQWGVTKLELLAAFHSSLIESSKVPGTTVGIYRYDKLEICAMYRKDPKGQWIIISCWKRPHYP